jgi:hypothetical protein
MITGENSRPGDLDVNVTKEKKLTKRVLPASSVGGGPPMLRVAWCGACSSGG